MTRYLDLYWHFLIQRFKVLMEYRASLILGASSTIVWQASSIAAVWVVMQKVPSLNGWGYDEVLLAYGLVTLAKSINHMFADNLWTVGRVYIRSGGFERFLQESQLSGQHTGDTTKICPASLNYTCYYKEFLCSGWGVPMQGTGIANDGKYIKYVSGGGPWSSGYLWWQNCNQATFSYVSGVTGASGRTLVANYSIAVDPNYIPLGYYVWIDQLNRWFRADDTGGAITGYRIDVYTGTSNPSYNLSSGMFLTSTPHAATDPSPYGSGGGTVIVDDRSAGFTKYGPSTYCSTRFPLFAPPWNHSANSPASFVGSLVYR